MRSSWGAGAVLAVACIGGLAALLAPAAACTPHNCDSSSTAFDLAQGIMSTKSGQARWASSAWDGTWIPYPANVTITVSLPGGFALDPATAPDVWVSTGLTQDAGATSTQISGQAAEFTYLSSSGFELTNGSCADYYVWISVAGTVTGDAGRD